MTNQLQLDHDIIAALERIVARTPSAGPTPSAMFIPVGDPPRRRPILVAAGALAVAGVVATGVIAAQRTEIGSTEVPVSLPRADTPPINTGAPTVNTGPTPVPAPTAPAAELTLFPVIGAQAQPGDLGSYGYTGADDNPERVTALVARRDGSTLTDGIQVEAVSQAPELLATPDLVTIHGITVAVYTEQGSPLLRTVVFPESPATVLEGAELPGHPAILVQGIDPVGFLQSAGKDVIGVLAVSAPDLGQPSFTLSFGTLPAGYELVLAPFEAPRGMTHASTVIGTSEESDGSLVEVSLMNPLPALAIVGTLTPVDINGLSGWISSTAGNAVIWEPEPGTFATVAGTPSPDEALAIARSVRFVDEATWQQFYDVAPPDLDNG